MAEIRPRSMTQGEFAEMLRENGFTACSKAAVSLAERSKESGVQFTPEARNVARRALNSTTGTEEGWADCPRYTENRKNPNKTTVWLDDDTRIWLEERAYMEDSSVGAVIRAILAEAKKTAGRLPALQADRLSALQADRLSALHEKAASDAGTSETAGEPMERRTADCRPYGYSENITKTEENQDETL